MIGYFHTIAEPKPMTINKPPDEIWLDCGKCHKSKADIAGYVASVEHPTSYFQFLMRGDRLAVYCPKCWDEVLQEEKVR